MNLETEIRSAVRDIPDFPKPGIVFKDITPLFYRPELCTAIVNGFISRMPEKPDAILGVESRGFLFGFLTANKLGIPFVLVRKSGKLPYKTIKIDYNLEYGSASLEIHEDALRRDWNVVIHDDLLATGGTAEAAARLVERAGAKVQGFDFVIGLDFLDGRAKLVNHTKNITCLVQY